MAGFFQINVLETISSGKTNEQAQKSGGIDINRRRQKLTKSPAQLETVGVSGSAGQSLEFPCEGLWVVPCGRSCNKNTGHTGHSIRDEAAVISISLISLLESGDLEVLLCAS